MNPELLPGLVTRFDTFDGVAVLCRPAEMAPPAAPAPSPNASTRTPLPPDPARFQANRSGAIRVPVLGT